MSAEVSSSQISEGVHSPLPVSSDECICRIPCYFSHLLPKFSFICALAFLIPSLHIWMASADKEKVLRYSTSSLLQSSLAVRILMSLKPLNCSPSCLNSHRCQTKSLMTGKMETITIYICTYSKYIYIYILTICTYIYGDCFHFSSHQGLCLTSVTI